MPGFAWTIEPFPAKCSVKAAHTFNLAILPLNYQNKAHSLSDIEMLMQRLKQTKPFNESVNTVRVWRVKISQDEVAKNFKLSGDFPPLKVRQDFIEGISSHLKANYKLIIIDASGGVSCAELSSVDKLSLVILGKSRYKDSHSFAKGFLHELGHSLGLRDEGLNAEARLSPPGPPNCATTQEEAMAWWGDLAGRVERVRYINGCCGNKDYIRPTIASLMNDADKAEDFGPVNERYLRKALFKN